MLSRAFATLVVLILLSGGAGILASVLQHRSVRELSEKVAPLRMTNVQLRVVMTDAQRALRGYLITGDELFLGGFELAAADFAPTVRRLRAGASSAGQRAAVEEQVQRADRWWSHADRQRGVPPRSVEAAQGVAAGRELFEAVVTANATFDADLARYAADVRHRSDLLRTVALFSLVVLTGLAALVAVLTAARTTARITRPLERLLTVLRRLAHGDHDARAPTDVDLDEVAAVTRATNAMADEAAQVRHRNADQVRLTAAAYRLGIRIREHLSTDAAMDEAAAGLGEMLRADHVVVRLASRHGCSHGGARWSSEAPAAGGEVAAPAGSATSGSVPAAAMPGAAGIAGVGRVASEQAVGLTPAEPVAKLSPDWFLDGGHGDRGAGAAGAGRAPGTGVAGHGERAYLWTPASPPDLVPPEERSALLAAGATAALTVAFHGGTGPSGAITLLRCGGSSGWTVPETVAAEAVAADLGRGLMHAHLYEREQELVASLRDLDNAKTDFMSTVSHELRTPLTSIAGYLEMLVDGDAGELSRPQLRMVAVIERNAARLQGLIEDLLVLSRIEAGTLRTDRREVEYGWLITSAVATVEPIASAAEVAIEADVGGILTGQADPDQIDRVLMNLLSNAVKFTPAGGKVRVVADRDGNEVVIEVSDTGVGVPAAEQGSLFTRFFRASNAVEQAIPGTGLGLAIVRTIVAHHGGQVRLLSQEGHGTTVTVRLPA